MLRLSPPGFQRFSQSQNFEVIYGGAEANVAVSLINFGLKAKFVTRIPKNDIGDACLRYLKKHGISTEFISRGGERLGIYFLERGTTVRSSNVIYDRSHSSISTARIEDFNWNKIFENSHWFHWTGITPALSQNVADITLEAVKKAKEMNLTVSCDLNYRSKLWNYGKDAKAVMKELVQYCDLVVGNEEDFTKVFDISSPDINVKSGKVSAQNYEYVAKQFFKLFPKTSHIAVTLRGSISATHNTWSGVLFDKNNMYIGPMFDIPYIVDRVGCGDAFNAGLIYGFLSYPDNLQKALDFAVSASCLKHTIEGDFNLVSVEEVMKVMEGNVSGRISR
jgi:2-dehydro-3-deoxygluconokinase